MDSDPCAMAANAHWLRETSHFHIWGQKSESRFSIGLFPSNIKLHEHDL